MIVINWESMYVRKRWWSNTTRLFTAALGALEHDNVIERGCVRTIRYRVVRTVRHKQQLAIFALQPKQLAGVCAGSVTNEHLQLVGRSAATSSPINKTMAADVVEANDVGG